MKKTTNVMRMLDKKKIEYETFCYEETGETNGMCVAKILGQNPDKVLKTLVTVSGSGEKYVFVIPVNLELDLKKAAKAVGEKSVQMLKMKDLFPITGYVHGGCSPIGMKKFFTTVVHDSVKDCDKVYFSAGKIGYQVCLSPDDLMKMILLSYADVAREV